MVVTPELEVVLILNVPPGEDAAVHKYAKAFWKYQWPWARKPAVFYDPRSPDKTTGLPALQVHSRRWSYRVHHVRELYGVCA